ncbi:SemiSWEET transporter [Segetibacter koreensis]|uniref:SemiSWEET transporter n=1 Tax=Segetibacter koreensis TaxID=398037 RepID=UPI00037823FC
MEITGAIGITAGILTSSSLLPQLIKIIKEKKVEALSIGMFITLMIGILLWIYYGVLRKDTPIIVTNSFSVFLNFLILFFRFKYRNNDK